MALDAAIVGVTAEWLVSSIDGLVETHPQLSREWVGLILLPIVRPSSFINRRGD
jgi:Ca2+:H+ antiporter